MSVKINKTRLVIRNDVASNWASKNPILLKGEMGFERDTRKFKLGDGVTNWNNLLYANITDLENYYTKEEIETIKAELTKLVQDEEARALIVEQGLDGRVNQVESQITAAESLINQVETQITEAESLINEVKEKVDNMVVEETDPTVPAWAKQPNKPEYTPEEIGEHGVATLDENGKLPTSYLPSYVDDVLEGFFKNTTFYIPTYMGTTELKKEKVNTIYFNTEKYDTYSFERFIEHFVRGTSTGVKTYTICTFKSGTSLVFKRDYNSTYSRTYTWIYLLDSSNNQTNLFYCLSERGNYSGAGVFNAAKEISEDEIIDINLNNDDIEYFARYISFHPFTYNTTPESGKIYVNTDDDKTYRWSGTIFVEISSSLALGETSSTAYAGDRGAYNRTKINEILTQLTSLQTKQSSSLKTTDKTIVGAINEIVDNLPNGDEIVSEAVTEAVAEAKSYTDTKSSQTLSSAKSYTDIAKAAAKSYTDSEISKINVSGGGGSTPGSGSGGGIVDIDKLPQLPIILEGTPIPSEEDTVVEKVYVNTINLMSDEEIKERIIDLGEKTGSTIDTNGFVSVWYTLYYLNNSDYSISKYLTIGGFSVENGDDFDGFCISYDEEYNETEEYMSHIIWCDEEFYNGCIEAGWEGMVMEGPGWNLQNIPDGFIECGGPGEFTISQSCQTNNTLNMSVDKFQAHVNDSFKDLFSVTPYVFQPNQGTSLPIDGTPINEIYFNFDATDEDIIPILEKMNTEVYPDDYLNDGSFMGGHVAELTNNSLSLYLYNNQYYIIGPTNSAFRTTINNIDGSGVIWASKGCSEVNSSIIDGWNPGFVEFAKNGYFPNDDYARGTTVSNYFIPLLSPIISSTPIEKQVELDENSIYRTPEKRYYNKNGYEYIEFATNKNPQTIQEVESLPGKTVKSGTVLPNNSPIDKIYFNFDAIVEDIIPVLDKMENSYWDSSFMGGHYVRLFQNVPLTLTSTVTFLTIDGAPDMFYTIGFSSSGRPENVSGEQIIWASKGCNMVNSSIIDGWNPGFVEFAKNGFNLEGDTLSTSNSNITAWVELLKDIISYTPFEEKFIPDATTNQKVIYKTPDGKLNSFNGEKFVEISTSENPIAIKTVEELPYFTNEGTAVPESGLVEKIYFNTKMDPIEVANILSTLEYYDLSSAGIGFPAVVVLTSADLSTGIVIGDFSGTDYKSYCIISQSSEGEKIIYDYSDSPAESAVTDDWAGIENIDINVENMLGVLGPQFGVSNQNDKVKNIISITPFENWDNINDETIYKVQKQTDGEHEKPKYVLLDKNTKTKTELGGVGIKDFGKFIVIDTDGSPRVFFNSTEQEYNDLKNNILFVKVTVVQQESDLVVVNNLMLTKSGNASTSYGDLSNEDIQFYAITGGTTGTSTSNSTGQRKIWNLIIQKNTIDGVTTYPAVISAKLLDI